MRVLPRMNTRARSNRSFRTRPKILIERAIPRDRSAPVRHTNEFPGAKQNRKAFKSIINRGFVAEPDSAPPNRVALDLPWASVHRSSDHNRAGCGRVIGYAGNHSNE